MAEIVEFSLDDSIYPRHAFIASKDGDVSGRYVRESDYAALLERHRNELKEAWKKGYRSGYEEVIKRSDVIKNI
jgi:hypothetical protein